MPRAARPRGDGVSEERPTPLPRVGRLRALALSALRRIDLQGLLLATAISIGGGALFFYFALPLPWMLGAATAYFAGAPGGLATMTLIGTAMGGDERTIALTHARRARVS